jgi:hypothetical protein
VKVRGWVVLAVVGGAAYWIYRTHPTVSGLVDDLTRPLMGSKAAVHESEHKRVVSEAPAVPEGEPVSTTVVREGMKTSEVESLLGRPDRVEPFEEKGKSLVRWIYLEAGRTLVFEEGRVVSIAIR